MLGNIIINLVDWTVSLSLEHGMVVALLAFGGLLAFLSFCFEKGGKSVAQLLLYFVAVPIIIILSLFNKQKRKERLKDLGEIRAYIKHNPTKFQKFVLYITILITIIVAIVIVNKILLQPLVGINSLTQNISN